MSDGAGDLWQQLQSLVGSPGPAQVARHPVTTAAIADWCDAIGDGNPCYRDETFAAKSRHGGIVAPPATLDIWDRAGLPAQSASFGRGDDPRARALNLLESRGYTGVVAVNSELEILRYLRPGDRLQNVQTIDDISPEKQTALGVGHFVTTRHRYTTSDGQHVGDLLFRILKFKPGTGTPPAADDAQAASPDPSPSLRPRPAVNSDNAALWAGYRDHELRLPQCAQCGRLTFPPTPRCAGCGGFAMTYAVASGRGSLYSHAIVHHPQVAGFHYPLPVGLVELEEGVRLVANVVGCPRAQLRIGMPLEVEWLDAGDFSLPQFRPATPPRRSETVLAAAVEVGTELPVWALPVTATRIVAGALASRDFQPVHHDRALAVKQGSRDIFLSINASVGFTQRYVTDWSGPEAVVTGLRVRLGAPAYAGSLLTFTGRVQSVARDSGRVVVGVQATNELGPHITGTVELELPQ